MKRTTDSNLRGFTIIELLTVMAIVIVLIALLIGVGSAVIKNQEASLTRNVLTALDRALEEYISNSNGSIPNFRNGATPETNDYIEVPGPQFKRNDSRFFRDYPSGGETFPIRPDAAVFLKQAMGVGQVRNVIAGLSERTLRLTVTVEGSSELPKKDTDTTPSVLDSWAQDPWPMPQDAARAAFWDTIDLSTGEILQAPILYVHPENKLAQELYGRCVNGRPYFMSAGPDRAYGVRLSISDPVLQKEVEGQLTDNIYSYPVGPFNTTAGFFADFR